MLVWATPIFRGALKPISASLNFGFVEILYFLD